MRYHLVQFPVKDRAGNVWISDPIEGNGPHAIQNVIAGWTHGETRMAVEIPTGKILHTIDYNGNIITFPSGAKFIIPLNGDKT